MSAETRSGADGKFILRLPPMTAGGPFELTVTSGDDTAVVRDVMIGEVWVASGQSNMEWTVGACGQQGQETIQDAANDRIRMLTVPRQAQLGRRADADAEWQVSSPETAAQFSAVAYHFAARLQDTLDVPVGILSSSWGGTIVEAWTSRQALVQNPDTRAWCERYEATLFSPEFWEDRKAIEFSFPADPGNDAEAEGWAALDFNDADWPVMDLPRMWQSAGHNFSGVFWFRFALELPPDWEGCELCLTIGAVDKQDITYFNGEHVGATGSGFDNSCWNVLRKYTVPGRLVRGGRNVVAVRAYSFAFGGGMIGPENEMAVTRADGRGDAIPLAGEWKYAVEHDLGLVQIPPPPLGPDNPNSPYMLYDNMISPLLPYGIRGAIWYQGESNANKGTAEKYRGMLVNMIRDWRRAWGQGDFPFIQVQLANFNPAQGDPDTGWPLLREAQFQALFEPGVGMATIIDIGEANDIHPKNKRDVGRRLAQWALVNTYDRDGVPSGPLYSSMTIEGKALRLHFDHVGAGLVAGGGKPLAQFVVAGLDREFHAATAVIEGATVVVTGERVSEPVAVRYAWADNPEGCNLYNRDGFPAPPFRTDTW